MRIVPVFRPGYAPTAATGPPVGQGDVIPMRETSPRGWHRWRVTVVKSAPSAVPRATTFDHTIRLTAEPATVGATPEPKGADGIRHELVARVRQQIADGTYDTEEKWLLAEEALLRRIEGRA